MHSKSELSFAVFLIHKLSEAWNKIPAEVYEILNRTNILDEYIIPSYDVLHTQGKECLVEDITEYVKEKGIEV